MVIFALPWYLVNLDIVTGNFRLNMDVSPHRPLFEAQRDDLTVCAFNGYEADWGRCLCDSRYIVFKSANQSVHPNNPAYRQLESTARIIRGQSSQHRAIAESFALFKTIPVNETTDVQIFKRLKPCEAMIAK